MKLAVSLFVRSGGLSILYSKDHTK